MSPSNGCVFGAIAFLIAPAMPVTAAAAAGGAADEPVDGSPDDGEPLLHPAPSATTSDITAGATRDWIIVAVYRPLRRASILEVPRSFAATSP